MYNNILYNSLPTRREVIVIAVDIVVVWHIAYTCDAHALMPGTYIYHIFSAAPRF